MRDKVVEEGSYNNCDVAIVGGALSGAAVATLLLRKRPGLKVLLIEKSTVFTRRVGEATVELSTYFLGRSLGLTRYLNESHLTKNGLRFWFASERTESLDQCSEIGGRYLARVPAYLVDRATLDEEVLRRAQALGAQLWRPASVQKVTLVSGGEQVLAVKRNGEVQEVRARWVVDASGVAALLARQENWWRPNHEHPTAAVWSRWKGVGDFEDPALAKKFPEWARQCYGVRGSATNHLLGDGWWAWWIPLKGGDVSIGVTFDQRRVQWPEGGSLGARLKSFLMQHPVGRELLANAEWTEGDVHWRRNLPYYSSTLAGDGFALVGDAAGFIDPFYSPGMDWISFTATTTAELILAQERGEPLTARIIAHNRAFSTSYERWFRAVYQDKYEYIGEYDLMRLAFLLDIGLYYFGVAMQPFKRGEKALCEPVFAGGRAAPAYWFMRFYNRRFARIARARRDRQALGRRNDRRRFMFGGYTFSLTSGWPIFRAIGGWAQLEMAEGWRSWLPSWPVTRPQDALPAAVSKSGESG